MSLNSDYYVLKKDYYLKQYDKNSKFFISTMSKEGMSSINDIIFKGKENFEALLPQIPYIGGKNNSLTTAITFSAMVLGIYRQLLSLGYKTEFCGKLFYESGRAYFNSTPYLIRKIMGKLMFSKTRLKKINKRAKLSQEKRYSGDWVFEILPAKEGVYDLGINYTQCGIVKFLKTQGAEELTPYLCALDYAVFSSLSLGLFRTKTLGNKEGVCNFRIKKNCSTCDAWPTPNIKRLYSKSSS